MATPQHAAVISIYKNIQDSKSKTTVALDIFLQAVQSGKWQDQVLKIRTIKDKAERRKAKESLPYVTISGFFAERRAISGLSAHSGFLSIDLDELNEELEANRLLLQKDPYVYSVFTSVSGTGLCALFKIQPEKHGEAFDGLADYLLNTYRLVVDPSGRDVSRPRYVSYDHDLFINDASATFRKYPPKPPQRKPVPWVFVANEFEAMIAEMVRQNVNCCESYGEWLAVGFGLAQKFGEPGRPYFHALSNISSKYDQRICDKQFDYCLRGHRTAGLVATIGTIYYHAKQNGIPIHSEKTRRITAAASNMKKSGVSAAGVAENLKKFENITDAQDIIDQVYATETDFSGQQTVVENIRLWLRQGFNLQRNEITRKIEREGRPMEDVDLNTMFLDCKNVFEDLSFELFLRVLVSKNTPSYNPIHSWFESRLDIQPVGVVDEFFSVFDASDNLPYFGKKWLVSVVASAYGTHSPLMLIFTGKRGNGKTEAFRRLLPAELQTYFGDIPAGLKDTDLNILMTQKIILLDDECGGKSKKDEMALKSMLSKQVFSLREPYGRSNVDLTRIATLCGTSNQVELLSDPTGNRRFLPIEITGIDFEKYNQINKESLWMEIYHLYRSAFDWQIYGNDIDRLEEQSEKFEEASPEREILDYYFERTEHGFMTTTRIKNRMETLTVQKYSIRRLGMELRRLGYERSKKYGVYGYAIKEKAEGIQADGKQVVGNEPIKENGGWKPVENAGF